MKISPADYIRTTTLYPYDPRRPFVTDHEVSFVDPNIGVSVEVPQGTHTDFASIPSWLQSFIQPIGPHMRAALIHDTLYRRANGDAASRAIADAVFLRVMKHDGVPLATRWLM